jgi:PAB1-binding protein PBP1
MARQKEREILSESANGNLHLAEERMQTPQEDKDESNRYEEMKYSGVYRAED